MHNDWENNLTILAPERQCLSSHFGLTREMSGNQVRIRILKLFKCDEGSEPSLRQLAVRTQDPSESAWTYGLIIGDMGLICQRV